MCASIDVCIYENAQVVPVCVCILCICSNVWMNARVIHVYILLSMGAKEKTRWSVHVYVTMRHAHVISGCGVFLCLCTCV